MGPKPTLRPKDCAQAGTCPTPTTQPRCRRAGALFTVALADRVGCRRLLICYSTIYCVCGFALAGLLWHREEDVSKWAHRGVRPLAFGLLYILCVGGLCGLCGLMFRRVLVVCLVCQGLELPVWLTRRGVLTSTDLTQHLATRGCVGGGQGFHVKRDPADELPAPTRRHPAPPHRRPSASAGGAGRLGGAHPDAVRNRHRHARARRQRATARNASLKSRNQKLAAPRSTPS
jgi:hypothetical protein